MFNQFNQAHNFSIYGGHWNNVAGDQNIHNINPTDPILYLWNLIGSLNATHNSETYTLRGCHPNTRESIRKYLVKRSSDPNNRPPLCWLSGPAGTGKTAVAQSVAKKCQESGTLVSSFFFSRNDARRNEPSCLFLSIAFGLAVSIPVLRDTVGEIIRKNPGVLHCALDIQFRELVVKPCRQLAATKEWGDMPRLVVIDGLDECQDSKTQKRLLEIITQCFIADKQFPLQFLICSRSEPAIREVFDSSHNKSIVDAVRLDDSWSDDSWSDYSWSDDSWSDVRTYLLDELTRICNQARGRGLSPPDGWPGSIISQLSSKAEGLFSYASTVARFADNDYELPWVRVDIILGLVPNPTSESPFRDLDQLYLQILSRYSTRKRLLDVLGMVIVLPHFDRYQSGRICSPKEISELLDLRPGEVQLILQGMHAVLEIPNDRLHGVIKIHHASFTDFLGDRSRSGDYYIDRKYYRLLVISCCFARLNKHLSIHRSSPEMLFDDDDDNWFLCYTGFWRDWCEGLEPTDELLRILEVFDWTALLDSNLRYTLRAESESLGKSYRDPPFGGPYFFEIVDGIKVIMEWLEKFPTAEGVHNVINCLKQVSSHMHMSLTSPLSQAISTLDTIIKWVGLFPGQGWGRNKMYEEVCETLQERQPLTSSVIAFKIVDSRNCQCSHQDQKKSVAFMECSYGVYYVPFHMFCSPVHMFLLELASSGMRSAVHTIGELISWPWYLKQVLPMPELLPHLRVTIPIMNELRRSRYAIREFLTWFKSYPEEYALEIQALMKMMEDEIEKENDPGVRPYFRWTGSELVVDVEEGEIGEQWKRQIEEIECVEGIENVRMKLGKGKRRKLRGPFRAELIYDDLQLSSSSSSSSSSTGADSWDSK